MGELGATPFIMLIVSYVICAGGLYIYALQIFSVEVWRVHVACLGACVRHLEGGMYHNVNCEDYSLQHLQQGHDNIHLSGLTCQNQNTSQYES